MKIFGKKLVTLSLLLSIAFVSLFPQSAFAAGSAIVSVEKSSSSVVKGKTVELRFYVTNSGANISGIQFKVTLSKLALSSYSPSNTPFNGFNGVVSGNSAGSTVFEIAAATGSSLSPGKKYIGKAIVTAKSTGTASANVSGVEVADGNNDPIDDRSGNGTTLSVVAPPTTPDPDDEPSTPTTGSNNSKPTSTPNPNSTAVVPDSDKEDPGSKTVPEQDLAGAFANSDNQDTEASTSEKLVNSKNLMYSLAGLLVLVVMLLIIRTLIVRKRKSAILSKHGLTNTAITQDTPLSPPNTPTETPSEKSDPQDPTIIRPQQ